MGIQGRPPGKPVAFPAFAPLREGGKTLPLCWTSRGRFAKRRPLVKAFPAGSGRIAQLVEQMTLNHRVPGSSPGAPTKLFKNLAKTEPELVAAVYSFVLASSFGTACVYRKPHPSVVRDGIA